LVDTFAKGKLQLGYYLLQRYLNNYQYSYSPLMLLSSMQRLSC